MDINITNPVTTAKIGEVVNGANAATPNDTDLLPIVDTAVTKKITLTNFKAFLKTYFDTLYTGGGSVWGSITGTLSAQTDLQNALNNKEPLKGADDNYVTDAQLVVIQNTSGTNTGDSATNSTSNTYADGKVADEINDGVTTIAPSQNAVFDALALKAPLASPTFTGVVTTPDITVTGLTSTRVVFATTGGELTDDANLTFGSGNLNVGTSVTTPLLIGGSAVGSKVSVKATTGNGTLTGTAFELLVGNNGATVPITVLNNGRVGINNTTPNNADSFASEISIGNSSKAGCGISIFSTTSGTGSIFFGDGAGGNSIYRGAILYQHSADSLEFRAGWNGGTLTGMHLKTSTFSVDHQIATSGASTPFTLTTPASTGQTAGTETIGFDLNMSATITHASNTNITTNRDAYFRARTHAFASATGTIATAATVAISGSPIAGANAAITNPYSLLVESGKSKFGGNIELTQTVTTEVVVSDTTVTVVINGTTYKLLARA